MLRAAITPTPIAALLRRQLWDGQRHHWGYVLEAEQLGRLPILP